MTPAMANINNQLASISKQVTRLFHVTTHAQSLTIQTHRNPVHWATFTLNSQQCCCNVRTSTSPSDSNGRKPIKSKAIHWALGCQAPSTCQAHQWKYMTWLNDMHSFRCKQCPLHYANCTARKLQCKPHDSGHENNMTNSKPIQPMAHMAQLFSLTSALAIAHH